MYKVVCPFVDLQDDNFPYGVGDKYPRKGLKPTKKRIAELLSTDNRRGIVLIEKVKKDVDGDMQRTE